MTVWLAGIPVIIGVALAARLAARRWQRRALILFITTGADAEHPNKGGVVHMRMEVAGLPAHRSRFAETDA